MRILWRFINYIKNIFSLKCFFSTSHCCRKLNLCNTKPGFFSFHLKNRTYTFLQHPQHCSLWLMLRIHDQVVHCVTDHWLNARFECRMLQENCCSEYCQQETNYLQYCKLWKNKINLIKLNWNDIRLIIKWASLVKWNYKS